MNIIKLRIIGVALILFTACQIFAQKLDWLDEYNVTWHSQSENPAQSMPCGGGDIGMNVWVEDNNLLFYLERSGNIDEKDQLLKTGRISIKMSPNPFSKENCKFNQTLDLKSGSVVISGKTEDNSAEIRIWAEVKQPIVHVEMRSEKDSKILVTFQSWRNKKQLIPISNSGFGGGKDYNRWACYGYVSYTGDVFSYPDVVEFENDNSVLFYHQNCEDRIFDKEVKDQQLYSAITQMRRTTKDRIFGGKLYGNNLQNADIILGSYANTPYKGWQLASVKPAKKHELEVVLNTQQTDFNTWKSVLDDRISSNTDKKSQWSENLKWWSNFWNRSYIRINPGSNESDVAWQIGRNYQLMRYMFACNAYGEFPTHFNAGLFNYDEFYVDGRKNMNPSFYNADYRKWGAWTGMNQRIVTWPFLKSGDFELMRPQFDFYAKNLQNATLRTKLSFNIDGCSFGEQINSGGLPNGYHYGWLQPFGLRKSTIRMGMQMHHTNYFHTQLEFAYMMHQWYKYTNADISQYIHFMKNAVIFVFEYNKMLERRRTGKDWDINGKLVLKNMQSTETYKLGTNPMPELASLRRNLECLLELPDKWVSKTEKEKFADWLNRVPPLNFRERNGHKTLSPLLEESISSRLCNREIPQLYPVFPYGIYALGQPDLDVAINTWKYGLDKAGNSYLSTLNGKDGYPQKNEWWGWGQQAIFLARMGLTDEAKGYLIKKLSDAKGNPVKSEFLSFSKARFPTFYGPAFGCMPSMEWGASGMIALQEMLLQTISNNQKDIRILPAWPKDWNVIYKLYAPQKTVVECVYMNNKINNIDIFPKSRSRDVIISDSISH